MPRKVVYGYKFREVMTKVVKHKPHIYKVRRYRDRTNPVLVHGGIGDPYWCSPRPDLSSTANQLTAGLFRLSKETPFPSQVSLDGLSKFTSEFLTKNFVPLNDDDIASVEDWIESRSWPGSKKRKLLSVWQKYDSKKDPIFRKKAKEIKCHIKDESYAEYKAPRGIYARSDECKIDIGQIVSAIEERMYQLPYFIKHIPVKDRPEYIKRLIGHCKLFLGSDYESFEGSFRKEVQEAVENIMFEYFTRGLTEHADFMEYMREYQGERDVHFHDVSIRIAGLRMSGEMHTSLANGFTNLMVIMYICQMRGLSFQGVVEGDDGLFGFDSEVPIAADFQQLGFSIKLNTFDDLYKASFCGIVFEPESCINITDPRDFLASLAWVNAKYSGAKSTKLKSLQKAKALSYYHQYPGCPIIQAAAKYVLNRTKSIDLRWALEKGGINEYERNLLIEAVEAQAWRLKPAPVSDNERVLMAEVFGVSFDNQIAIEKFFEDHANTDNLRYPSYVVDLFHGHWMDFSDKYVVDVIPDDRVFIPAPNPIVPWSVDSQVVVSRPMTSKQANEISEAGLVAIRVDNKITTKQMVDLGLQRDC